MQKTQHTVKIIAHRGDSSHFPENTLEAFEAALAHGADAIELDIHATNDGELVVHHDYYLGNPDNGAGKIPDVSYSYIQSLAITPGYHIPTLDEVFAKYGNLLHYELEVKAFTDTALVKILDTVRKYNLTEFVEFTSPHPYTLTKIKQFDKHLPVGYFAIPQPEWMDDELYHSICIAHAKTAGLDVLHCQSSLVNERFVQDAHAAGLRIHAADCDNKEDLARVIALGVDQLSTNQLAAAVNAAKKQESQS